jgi:cytoskeletal protein CcmA (bactofilin family)
MWKKDEVPATTPTPTPRVEATPRPERPVSSPTGAERATIGRSITIKGEVTGDEDLLIQGRVEGSVDLKQHSVTVGPEGEVRASIMGRVVTVEGKVVGDLTADEQVILRSAASVEGDITAPRVVLEDGARFRGGVDMAEPQGPGRRADGVVATPARKGPETSANAHTPPAVKGKSMTDTPAEVTT